MSLDAGGGRESERAGCYVLQPAGFRAFLPVPLPPDPALVFDERLLAALSAASVALGRLDGVSEILPDPDRFVDMYVRKEAVLSSQIEGTQASLADLLEFEAGGSVARPHSDVDEVANYVAAMNLGLAGTDTPLLELVRAVHARLLAGVRGSERSPGEFRRDFVWVGPPGRGPHEARFVATPPAAMADALAELARFVASPGALPPLVRAALVHVQFESIHPFRDGNGRAGRLLVTLMLCREGVLRRPLLYLSYFFRQNRAEYYERLQAVRDRGDWEGWLAFFLRGAAETARDAAETARRIVDLRERHRALVAGLRGGRAGRAMVLLDRMFRAPVTSVQGVAETVRVTPAAAAGLTRQLVELGILREVTGRKRDRRFAYAPYLELFGESEVKRAR